MGDTLEYKPNYLYDEAGIPYSHAPGNIGDIEIFNDNKYWLIEATLIRGKNQQVNNETVNLFRHINNSRKGNKYLTLIAPFIHDDTKLIFNVASVITIIKSEKFDLYSETQNTSDFIFGMKSKNENYFQEIESKTKEFITTLKNKFKVL